MLAIPIFGNMLKIITLQLFLSIAISLILLATFNGFPPKIIWLRIGNMTTKHIAQILIEKKDVIVDFIESEDYKDIACLELS